ncbi:MAG: anthranilate synthase component I [Cyanophyceae cyanobacterium]
MIALDFERFSALAKRGNFVPVYQELVADLDTPVSAWYRTCAGRPYSFLLESVEGGETVGRYSLLGCDPLWVLEARGDRVTQRYRNGRVEQFTGNPFEILQTCLAAVEPVQLPELPPGIGGLFGYWGYELIRWIEPRVPVYGPDEGESAASEGEPLPDGVWMQVDSLLVFDQVKRCIWAIAYGDLRGTDPETAYRQACDRVSALVEGLRQPLAAPVRSLQWSKTAAAPTNPEQPELAYRSNTGKERFCENVRRAQDHIKAGDIFQVVLSQRLTAPFTGEPFELYRILRAINPSPYMAFFQFDRWQLVGSSPEVMVKSERIDGDRLRATVRPIAGTRPRGKTAAEDAAYAEDLLADPKEIAEHVMLVDLGRNDLGRVCTNGTVRADELMTIERYSHVMHIVSNVQGELAADKNAWDLLMACFPAGTVSGAPKIRAMEIIHALEPDRRGPYSGAYGFYDFEGQLNTAITIRSAIVREGTDGQRTVSVQAGAGLVADSVPESEYQETLNKARGMLEAIRILQDC